MVVKNDETMKRLRLVLLLLVLGSASVSAQKFACVDTEYILNKIPAYKSAKEQLDKISKGYESEVDKGYAALDEKLKQFQSEQMLLTADRRQKKQELPGKINGRACFLKLRQSKIAHQKGDCGK